MNDHTATADPAAIERDIRRTQEDMSRTVDKIGDQLTFKNVVNALLDKADQNNVDTQYLIDGARRNPIALGLIAAGAIWLVSDKDSKIPSLPKRKPHDADELDLAGHDVHHRDYVSHMSAVEMRDGEDPATYQRRRDIARSNFFMVERNHEEDDHSFRSRLDGIADSFREKRRAWADSATETGASTKRQAQMAMGKTQEMYDGNPLVGGIIAAAVGAALASSLPVSRQEQEKLGSLGEKARDMVGEQKDHLLETADEKLQQTSAGSSDQGGQQADQAAPFMIGESNR